LSELPTAFPKIVFAPDNGECVKDRAVVQNRRNLRDVVSKPLPDQLQIHLRRHLVIFGQEVFSSTIHQ